MPRAKAVMHPVPLRATKDGAGAYHFVPESDLWNAPEEEFVFHKGKYGMREKDYHLIEFVLDDQTGDALKFPDTPHDAMWVIEGAERAHRKCPDMHSVSNYEVLEPICVTDGGNRLIVRNENPRVEHWSFTLNFVKQGEEPANPSRYVAWDPGGNNQDGGSIG